ncbi:MAG TPA: hypothetical protein VF865_07095 [Acidobacteriaceae bacterium]
MRAKSIVVSFAVALVAALPAIGQSTQGEPIAAPAPSAKFPAVWYQDNRKPNDAWPSTQAPIAGAPYSATMVTTYADPPEYHGPTLTQRAGWYRDSAGRTRTEEANGLVSIGNASAGPTTKTVEVHDVVTHCMFRWSEPWSSPGEPIAAVSCSQEMYFSPWDTSGGVKSQTASESTQFSRTTKNQPLGHKTIDGVDCLGMRSTLTTTLPAKEGTQQPEMMVIERWWSPQLNVEVWFGPVPPQPGLPTFELKDIHAGAPDPILFYPPSNYKIVHQVDTFH